MLLWIYVLLFFIICSIFYKISNETIKKIKNINVKIKIDVYKNPI